MPLYGEQAVEPGLALGIPGACAEPVQYAELGYRSDCELLLLGSERRCLYYGLSRIGRVQSAGKGRAHRLLSHT